jgi:hypothetical protein
VETASVVAGVLLSTRDVAQAGARRPAAGTTAAAPAASAAPEATALPAAAQQPAAAVSAREVTPPADEAAERARPGSGGESRLSHARAARAVKHARSGAATPASSTFGQTGAPAQRDGADSSAVTTGANSRRAPSSGSVAARAASSGASAAPAAAEPIVIEDPQPAASAEPATEPVRPAPAPQDDARLEREMAMLSMSQRVLHTDPERALNLARQGESEFPGSMFTQERQQLLLLSLVKLGRMDEAKRLAKPYLARYPKGPFSDRVRRALLTGRVER